MQSKAMTQSIFLGLHDSKIYSQVCFGEENSQCNQSDRVAHGCWEGLKAMHGKAVRGHAHCGITVLCV